MGTKLQQKEETPTQQQSLTLMRNLLRTSISSISYLRGLFPEDSFKDRNLAGIGIKSLVPASPNSQLLVRWLEDGVFEALEKKYLRELVFGIGTSKTELQESYNFLITYSDSGPSVQLSHTSDSTRKMHAPMPGSSKDDIKRSTVMMLRNLVALSQTLNPVADNHVLTMKLLYYDDITPPDYEPKFFRPAPDELPAFSEQPVKLKVGRVNTPFHSLALKVKTTVDVMEEGEEIRKVQAEAAQPLTKETPAPGSPLFSTPPPKDASTPRAAEATPDEDFVDSPSPLPKLKQEARDNMGTGKANNTTAHVAQTPSKDLAKGAKESVKVKPTPTPTPKEAEKEKEKSKEQLVKAKTATREDERASKQSTSGTKRPATPDPIEYSDANTQEPDELEYSTILRESIKKHKSASTALLLRECPGITELALKKILAEFEKEGLIRFTAEGYTYTSKKAATEVDVKSEAHRLLHGTIEWMLKSPPAITAVALSKALEIDAKLAKGLIARLEKDEVLGPHQGKKGREVNEEKAKAVIAKIGLPPRTPTRQHAPQQPTTPFRTPQTPEELRESTAVPAPVRPSPSLSKLPRTTSRRIFAPSPAMGAAATAMPPPLATPVHAATAVATADPFPPAYQRSKNRLGPMIDSQESQPVTSHTKVSVIASPLGGKRRRVEPPRLV